MRERGVAQKIRFTHLYTLSASTKMKVFGL